jgi:glycosyltransferase involved in cell wall biosynthesis
MSQHSAPNTQPPSGRALIVSSVFPEAEALQRIGREAYSYHFVQRAFAPLLARWGRTQEVTRPESRLDYALWRARQQNLEPVHLSFTPLHLMYLTARAPNVSFPFWEFPDIPNTNLGNNPRNNWVRIAGRLDLILTASTSTREAFVRAGVATPIHVVPVPIAADYFAVPDWEPGQRLVLDCPAYVFPQPEAPPAPVPNPWVPANPQRLSLKAGARKAYKVYVKPRVPRWVDKYLTLAVRAVVSARQARNQEAHIPYPASPTLALSGVVYSTIFNPFDPRKNWQDLLSAYLYALGDQEDATLVVKLVVCPELAAAAVNTVVQYYQALGLRHRCKLAFVSAYLSEAQMVELARASTYYLNTARAEGACLPLQSFLAAGRPGIAPVHTAMADYFSNEVGFIVSSHPEPACWPHDPDKRCTTTWHRLVWQALHDQLRASYALAKQEQAQYQVLARRGREQITEYASAERVWPHLAAALDGVAQRARALAPPLQPPSLLRHAS